MQQRESRNPIEKYTTGARSAPAKIAFWRCPGGVRKQKSNRKVHHRRAERAGKKRNLEVSWSREKAEIH